MRFARALALFSSNSDAKRSSPRPGRHPAPRCRPALEALEDRVVMSSASVLTPAAVSAVMHQEAIQVANTPAVQGIGNAVAASQVVTLPGAPPSIVNVTNLTPTGVAGVYMATVQMGNATTMTQLTVTPSTNSAGTPILELTLNPIHLDLLGLNVNTSKICLDITSTGQGLLGSLLGNVTGALTGAQLRGVEGLLNDTLGHLIAPASLTGGAGALGAAPPASCDLLHLSLGPVNLNVLGLNVRLDNCAGGPVLANVTAVPSEGLLGNLLCRLDELLTPNQLLSVITQEVHLITGLL